MIGLTFFAVEMGSEEAVMNASLGTADALTHVKIVTTALIAGVIVIWVGLAARANERNWIDIMRAHPPMASATDMLAKAVAQ